MRSQFAAAAALVGAAVAVPAEYKPAGYSTPAAPVYTPTETPVYTPTETPCETEAAVYSTPAEVVYSTPAEVVYSSAEAVYSSAEVVYSTPEAVYSTAAAEVYSSAAVYTPAPSAPATYVICSTELVTVTSCAAYVTNCPADHTAVYTSLIPYSTTTCEESEAATLSSYWIPYTQVVSTPVVYSTPAVAYSTPCPETETATYAAGVTSVAGGAPYPTGGAVTYPVGTATYPAGTAYPTGTGAVTAYPPTFTGAASGVKAGLSVAGLGAIAALFL